MPMWFRLLGSLFLSLSEKYPDLEVHPAILSKPPDEGFVLSWDSEDNLSVYKNGLAHSPKGETTLFIDCWVNPNIKKKEIDRVQELAILEQKAMEAISEWAESFPNDEIQGSLFVRVPRVLSDAGAYKPRMAIRIVLEVEWNMHGCEAG